MKNILLCICLAWTLQPMLAQQATVKESKETLNTYPFFDPDPVADPSDLFYPYFRFDGFSANGVAKDWKSVILENDYIKVTLFPEVGGKVWGAVDKTSGKEFIYYNHAVKFRDIAMRGPWTSGGIEFNFGIIGHAPTSTTPIDYLTQEKEDGSVSCYVASYDWVTRTVWNVEVNLPKDKAYFTTKTTWYNQSDLDQPYYQWMNAGYPAAGNAQFCYPGNKFIGHGGEVFPFPVDNEGRDLSWYEKNNFGPSKSEHVLGYYNDYYGVYWHDKDFGSIHHSGFDEKLGMKIFLWGLSREGGIWEDLLTDTDGQYIELQSGRMYNQPASNSSYSPYKQYAFGPQMTDQWTEYWYPVDGIKGVSKASRIGALNVTRKDGNLNLAFSPLEALSTTIKLYNGDKLLKEIPLQTSVLKPWTQSIPQAQTAPEGSLRIVIGDDDLVYSEVKDEYELNRPTTLPEDFDWNSLQGLYVQGEQWMNQKVNDKAEHYLKAALEKDKYFMPALNRLASLYVRQGKIQEALALVNTALSLDTYDGEANYLYGLCNQVLGKSADAKSGYSIASRSAAFRSAAYTKLASVFFSEGDYKKAEHYALLSLDYNNLNLEGRQILMTTYRKTGHKEKAQEQISFVLGQLPLYHPARFEKYLLDKTPVSEFTSLVRNELPDETYLEIADWYKNIKCYDEAIELLSFAPNSPIALYEKAFILSQQGKDSEAKILVEKANELSPEFVFPFRASEIPTLQWASTIAPSWKTQYYQALIYWTNQNKEKSLEILNQCDNADYAPLFLTRSTLKQGTAQLSDILKAENLQTSWRTGMALMNYYTGTKEWKTAVETGAKYMKLYPSNYYIGLKYAKALCEDGQYAKSISFLRKLQVLPNEGSYAGKAVFREANLNQALDYLKKHNYSKATTYLKASQEWPENLGVGKPYDEMLDNRVEDYMQALIAEGSGKEAVAQELFAKVASRRSDSGAASVTLLSALSMKKVGKAEEADKMMTSWSAQYPNNKIVEWCTAIYDGDTEKASTLLKARTDTSKDATPWETSFRDNNFELITKLVQ